MTEPCTFAARMPAHGRGPNGPCEDIAQCPSCWTLSASLRPLGELFYDHAESCPHVLHWGPCSAAEPVSNRSTAWFAERLGAARRDGARQALEAAGDAIDALYKAKGASKDYANLSYQEGYLDGLDAAEQLVRPASVDASLPVLGLATPEPPTEPATPKEQQQ